MNSDQKCEFCLVSNSPVRVPFGEVVNNDVCVCNSCWKLLQNPETALPLIRGQLTMTLRGRVDENDLKGMINNFMESIAKWRKRIKN